MFEHLRRLLFTMRETSRDKQIGTIYNELIKQIRGSINPSLFDTLFSGDSFELKSLSNNKAVFVADSESNATIIRTNLLTPIQQALSKLMETPMEIEITDKKTYAKRDALVAQANRSFFQNSLLQQNLTFENFVIGPNNRDAYLASLIAVENPGNNNPIFLYSKSGLGKTHLLHAIGNATQSKYPDKKVLYITSDDFITEFVKYSLGNKDSNNLKDFFNTIDLLLVDDIQFLAKREGSQMMFFNVFNLLVNQHKQIVLTSDRSPSELKDLPDRLVSRFAGGLSIAITSPNQQTLVEILKMKIKISGLKEEMFEPEVLTYLADNYGKNVRELEGAYTNLLFAIATHKQQGLITLDFTRSVFEADEERKVKSGKVNIDSVITTVADYYGMSENQLKSKVRTSQIALARQIAMYLSRKILSLPYQEIGKVFGKDHSTVLTNVQKIEKMKGTDESLNKVLNELSTKIKAEQRA